MVQKDGGWEQLGFTPGEGKVYSAVLYSQDATLQRIHEQTGLERRSVYDIINKLISRGLVAYYTENGHKIYRATSPKNLMLSLEDEKKEIEDREAALRSRLPSLIKAHESWKPEFDVRIYRGREGIRALFNEMLDYPDHYFIGGNWGAIKYLGEKWWSLWDEKRVARKIRWHDLIVSKPEMMASRNLPKEYYECRVLPPGAGSPNVVFIFGDRVANVYWGESLFAFVIENPDISKSHLSHFRLLWDSMAGKK